jgi:hypothetical protein
MPRRPTGNPVGRPFTYTTDDARPVTYSLRVPRDLSERLKGYAARHRRPITELLLDGLRWRLDQEDPRYAVPYTERYYDNTVLHELATPVHLLDGLVPFDEEYPSAPATPAGPKPQISYDNNTVIQQVEVSQESGVPGETGSPAPTAKAVIVARLRAMREQGMSLAKMAAQLTAEGVPTLTGKTVWQKGVVDKLVNGR